MNTEFSSIHADFHLVRGRGLEPLIYRVKSCFS
nr:MAG TPA: hypothetical protein [Caudoviricetes sp.]